MGLIEEVEAALAPSIVVQRTIVPMDAHPIPHGEYFEYVENRHYLVLPRERFDRFDPRLMNKFMERLIPKGISRAERPMKMPFHSETSGMALGQLVFTDPLGVLVVGECGQREFAPEEREQDVPQEFLMHRPAEPPYISVYTRLLTVRPFPDLASVGMDTYSVQYRRSPGERDSARL